jgi:hypothetical protein
MPWRSVYETNERIQIQYKWSSTFIDLCLQYWCVFPVCADWLLLIDLWHPNWRAARNHHRDPCRLSFTQRACSQARSLFPSQTLQIITTLQIIGGAEVLPPWLLRPCYERHSPPKPSRPFRIFQGGDSLSLVD